ncbi:ferrous iron transport protein B [Wohlfahrtiimonas chitiniclastica]|uniref:ferrous iron transport protein B n=1 Tax=Wohlfahrtiimonas chitiniclastica TaxID=400946 RepID=UPI000B9835CE|nr:ferrous iron transport protein B [Wohlfahrtiimonas chitiniclastica]OYQ71197.1 ferrous iron transport protein B [Wohlfahrtiimonas chitiniclastica]OYQ82953.1 ferrous iron transport protein B [Wohlfahrtiimonas chitiniclastica]OYQ85014.1 ferrous iron transport protein B [Wohlfahrtiimonas chitiniclastica]OYQ86752.1 ferrous iron transport protein B [Wohlfahrtiimonas chitiniclastica]
MTHLKVALAGQPNCGKSTLFTMMSGVKQHVANYPGVTVEKKSTFLNHGDLAIELVDLPGTYSFSAFSKEEQATIRFILEENPDVIINVVDAACFKRSLYLTFQLLELGKPVITVLNMMDIAKRRGIHIDKAALSQALNTPVIEAVGSKGIGKAEILAALSEIHTEPIAAPMFDDPTLESHIQQLSRIIDDHTQPNISSRWLALKILEENRLIRDHLTEQQPAAMAQMDAHLHPLQKMLGNVNATVASVRHQHANRIYDAVVTEPTEKKRSLTSMLDAIVLNRYLSFMILAAVIYGTYELSIVKGYEITNYTWPYLAQMKNFIISLLPEPEFIHVPMITELVIWLVNSALALLNYIPIFLILFIIIAILEDTGYMPRIAFVLDRVFNRYGLHGQSTLPLVLGGAFVGGCAVPGIMATKGIADEQARIATIMTVPYMNCLAKVPFYTLLLGAFFAESMSLMMFFISTITFFIALSVARVLTLSLLKHRERTPFIMELPPYHLPTVKGVLIRAFQRIWVYIHKVGTIVMAVAIVLFVLLQFPGLSTEKSAEIDEKVHTLLHNYDQAIAASPYYAEVSAPSTIYALINLNNQYRAERMAAAHSAAQAKAVDEKFAQRYPELFAFIKPTNPDARKINQQIRLLAQKGQLLQNEIKNDRIEHSFLGMFGRALEPITQWAGFDWRINVAFLSSFAARESAVATIGSIYENGKAERPEEAFGSAATGYNALHAVAMLIFMIFTPPCIASMVVVKLNVQSYKLMLLAIFMPFILGLAFASLFYTLGDNFGWSGLHTMGYFYGTIVFITLALGFTKRQSFTEDATTDIETKASLIQPTIK